MRSVMASLLSFTALGRFIEARGLFMFAMFCKVSDFSLKNFSILSLSLMIRSVAAFPGCYRFSVLADEAEPDRSAAVPSSTTWLTTCTSLRGAGERTLSRLEAMVAGLEPVI